MKSSQNCFNLSLIIHAIIPNNKSNFFATNIEDYFSCRSCIVYNTMKFTWFEMKILNEKMLSKVC